MASYLKGLQLLPVFLEEDLMIASSVDILWACHTIFLPMQLSTTAACQWLGLIDKV